MSTCSGPPYAYYRVEGGRIFCEGLLEHSLATARLALMVFGERLNKTFGTRSVDLLKISAYLHDVGKASDYYYRTSKKDVDTMSFRLHHLVSSLVLYLSYIMGKSDNRTLQLASYIALRHHQAMKSTLEAQQPQFYSEGSRVQREIALVVRGLNEDWIQRLLSVGVEREFISKEYSELMLRAVEELKRRSNREINVLSTNLASSKVDINDMKLIASVAGAIIVADNVISALNRGGESTLVKMWIREIPYLEEVARYCIEESKKVVSNRQ